MDSSNPPRHDTEPPPSDGAGGEAGLLTRVAESAARLASGVVRDGARAAAALDTDALVESKPEQQQQQQQQHGQSGGGGAMSHECMAESSRSGAARRRGSDSVGLGGGPAAASFRQAARSAHNRATEPIAEASSHQVRLAENLDGRGVTDFLAQSMPTSISIGAIGGPSPGLHVTAQQHGAQATRPADPADPVSYLQSTTYAADMERDDDRYQPHSADQSPATTGPDRSWGLQGTAVLEEWQLNEAWDRAWMGTAWASARKREKAAGGDAAEPTSKNLSNLLKPRM